MSDYIWKQCVTRTGEMEEKLDPDCASPVSDNDAQAILSRYVAALGLPSALRFWVTNQKVASVLVRGTIKTKEALERQVEAEIDD